MPAYRQSQFYSGNIRELFFLSVPVFLSLLSSNMMLFCDRYFLARFSIEAFNSVGIASCLVMLFQVACIRFTSTNQVFVGRCLGEEKLENIGPYTWQMIWISLMSFLVTFPISIFAGKYYFANIEQQALGREYFSIMMFGNFLFPLGASLAAFQLGLKNTKKLSAVALIANFLNVVLDYYLINGVSSLFDPLGVKGAAIATCISQGVYCIILFVLFINHPLKNNYKTKCFHFNFFFFRQCLEIATPSTLARIMTLFVWASSMNLVAQRGGDYVTLISFGSTIVILISIVNESLVKGVTTLFSYFLGQNNWEYVWKSLRSGIFLLLIAFCLSSLFFIIYKDFLIAIVLGDKITNVNSMNYLRMACYWLWIFMLLEGISSTLLGLMIAMKETVYLFKVAISLSVLTTYVPYYLLFKIGSSSPDKIWVITWFWFICNSLLYLTRAYKSYRKNSLKKYLV